MRSDMVDADDDDDDATDDDHADDGMVMTMVYPGVPYYKEHGFRTVRGSERGRGGRGGRGGGARHETNWERGAEEDDCERGGGRGAARRG